MKSSVQDEKFSKIKSKCCALKKSIFAIMDYQHNELIQGSPLDCFGNYFKEIVRGAFWKKKDELAWHKTSTMR